MKSDAALRPLGERTRAWLATLLAVLLVFAAGQIVEYYAQQGELEEERSDAVNRLSALRARLEGVVNANLSLVHGLTAVIESRPDIDQEGFAAIARGLVGGHALRNIAAAPDMVLSLMYPLEGNQAALGLDFRTHPVQSETALRARDSRDTVIAGPLTLAQGGIAIIAREPVFLDPATPDEVPRFWGLVSAVMDVDTLYSRAGLRDPDLDLHVALRGADGSGSTGPVFFGDEKLFSAEPVTAEVILPGGGTWQMAAVPADGWGRPDESLALIRLMALLAALLAGATTYRLVRSAQTLASQGARLHTLVNTIPDLVWLKDVNGVYLACNPRFELLFGAPAAEIKGRTDHDFVPADLADFFREKDRAAIAAGGPCVNEEWVTFASDGHRELLETIKTPVYDEGGGVLGVLGIARDITQRQRDEAELQRQKDLLDHTGRLARVGGWTFDVASTRVTWTDETARIHDLEPRPELDLEQGLAFFHGESRRIVEQVVQDAIAGGQPFQLEVELTSATGARKWVSVIGVPALEDGKVVRLQGAIQDISERKRMEDEIRRLNVDLEERVRQRTTELAAANKELQTFTYSVSHDLKAPLRGIDGYSRLLLEDHRDQLNQEGRLFLDNVRNGVTHMARLIEDLLAYSRLERRSLHGETLDLASQVDIVLDDRRAELQTRGVVVELSLGGLSACADPEGLGMVLRNLVDNALKFTRDSQPPSLAISATQTDKSVVLKLKDNGIGFDMRFHDRIFEIFQRLQRAEDYAGTGVGLAIVHKAMQRMGGRVWAESTPGRGASFYLELPR